MGVPGFYSWLTRRYPLIKHMLDKKQIPKIDYLYLDMNGIIYKCVRDDSIIFKSQILPKQLEEIWIEIFNYINMIVNLLKPAKMIFMALDGVAPRSKMNNQRSRRFKSARDYKQYIENFYGYNQNVDSQENFKNNSISPGTQFMSKLNEMLKFFILKKIEQDEQWRKLSVIFTGSDSPGQGQHKIMEFLRANKAQFQDQDNHCLYGADADLIMLGLTLPMKNVLIIRQQFVHSGDKVSIIATRQQKKIQFQIIFLTLLRQYFEIEYLHLREQMKIQFKINRIINDFVFLFFFIGNDFLPRCMTYNIRKSSIEKLIIAFKNYLVMAEDYIVGEQKINIAELAKLTSELAKYESIFIQQKAEDSRKFLAEKEKFESEFNEQIKTKVRKQTQFLLQMKTLYANQDGSQSKLFYEQKFNVDPVKQSNEFSTILISYYYGLNFVYQYYFVNLPSWSWYYPYYYAPLLSDLSYYLQYLAQTQYKPEIFEEGKPFEPFKQLLCILPKQSAELLPKAFQDQLLNNGAALRSPIDFYPDSFDSDMYGSTYEYQAISLIPFLNHQMVQHVYEKNIVRVQPEELKRNQLGDTVLYEYDQLSKQVQIQSPFPHIDSFKCNIAINPINLRNLFKWAHIRSEVQPTKLLRMPSLKIKTFEPIIKSSKRDTINFNMKILQPDITEVKMGSQVFYGYPLEHSGEVQAVLTKSDFKFTDKFRPSDYSFNSDMDKTLSIESIKRDKFGMFKYILQALTSRQKYPYFNMQLTEVLFFISDTQCFVRTLSGKFVRSFQQNNQKSYEIVPGSFVSKEKFYETTKDTVQFKSLEQEFIIGEQVLVLNDRKYLGAKCKVKGYNKELNKVKVCIVKELKQVKMDTILAIANTDQVYFTLRFAAELVNLRPDILLTIIGSVHVSLPKYKNLPQAIDIGLNFIDRFNLQLVPNLVRINYDKEQIKNLPQNKVFMKMELSLKAIQLLVEYRRNYSDVFDFIKARHQRLIDEAKDSGKGINWKENIEVQKLFKNQEEAVKSLMRVYLWLIKKEETHMPLSSVYSKQISRKKILKLQELFKQRKTQLKDKKYHTEPKDLEFDPNFLFSIRLAQYGLIHLTKKPENHFIGDAVICLKKEFFGEYGIIVGIDDQKYEVLFENPSFGKSSLKGLCDNLWGGKFNFRDLFNVSAQWWKFIQQRRKAAKITQEIGWVQCQQAYFPKFKSNPLRNFQDVEKLKKLIPEKLYQYMQTVRVNIKQVNIDSQFIVLDNKRQDHYYKYTRNQSTIDDKQADELKKNMKYVQKPILAKDIMGNQAIKTFQPEVIQNIAVEEPKNSKQQVKKSVDSAKNEQKKLNEDKKQKPKIKYMQKAKVELVEQQLTQHKQQEQTEAQIIESQIVIGEQQEDVDGFIG